MADNILETLIVELKANMQPLEAGLTQAARESQQAGQRIGQGLQAGIGRTSLSDDGVKLGQGLTAGITQGLRQGERQIDAQLSQMTEKARVSGGGFGGALSAGLGQGLAPALGNLGGLSAGLGNVTGAMGGAAAAAGPLAAGIAGVTAAVGASVMAMNSAINAYAEYEYKLAKISTLTDKTPGELKSVGRELQALSRETGKTIEDLGEAMYAALGASVRGAESTAGALNLVTVATKTASAGATDTATAMEALTNVLNAYRMEAGDAAQVSDKMVKAVAVGKFSFSELAQSLGMVTAIASQAGVSLDEVLGSLATMTANGIQMSSAVDYLRSAISAIVGPSDEAQKLAKKLGIEFNETALKSKGFEGVLKDVMRATGGSTEQLKALFGGVEAVTAVTSVASGNFERLTANIKAVGNAAGETETQASKMTNTLKTEGERFNRQWESIVRNMGEIWAPLKVSLLTDVNDLLEKFNQMLEKWNVVRNAQGSAYRLDEAERNLKTNQDNLTRVRGVLSNPNASEFERGRAQHDLEGYQKAVAFWTDQVTKLRQEAAQARKDLTQYGVQNSTATLPKGVQGPNMGGAPGAPTTVVVRGEDLQTLMGLGGKRTGTPYGQGYSFTKADGSVYSGTHNGEDIFAPKGTNVLAPFTGMLTARWSETTGNVIEMIDAAGNKLLLGHLDKYAAGLQDAIKKAGGQLLVQQGQLIAHVGNTGNLTGRGDGNSHIHMMAYDKSGRIVNPLGANFTSMQGDAYFTGSSASANAAALKAGTPPPGAPSKDDLKTYSLNLADWNKNQARALELAREAAKAESDLTGKRGLQVKAAMEAWAGQDKARQQSYQLAVQLTARQDQAAAKAKTDADQQARAAEAREKEAQQRAARINEALRQGKIESARNELTRLQTMRENDLRNAGENAQKVAQVEQRYAKLTYDAKAAIALKEKQDRDADIANDKTLNGPARAQALRNSNQTYLNALKAAGNERNAALDRVNKDLEATAAQNAAVMPALMSGWVDDWAKDQEKDRDAAAAGAAVVTKLFDGAIDQLGKSRAEMEAALTEALTEIYQKAIDAGIDPFSGGSPDQFRDMTGPGRSGLAALIGGNPAGFLSAYTATGGAPDDLLKEFADADWESLGLDVLQGLADGMRSDTAWDGVRSVVEGALGRILADSAFAADIAALVSDRDMTLGAPGGIVTGNELPEAEGTPLAQTVALRKALDDYAASLRGMKEDQLDAAEAEAIAGDNADFYNAILAERERRLRAQADAAEAAAKAERELADAIAKTQADAIAQAAKDTADYNAAQDALAKSSRELGAAMGQTEAPYQNQIDSLEELKTKMPKMADEIDALIKKWKELQGTMQAADMAGQIAGAVSQIGALFDKVNGAEGKGALSILGDWMQMNVTAYKQFQSGDVVGAVMTTLNGILNIGESIAELNAGLREWKKNLREVAEEQKKVLGMSSGGFKSPWEDALKKDAGNREQLANSRWYQRLWWGLTGGGPQVISDEAAKLLTDLQEIFAQLGDGIADAFTDAMLSAFEAGDMSQFAENFSKQFDAVVGKVVLKTMIEAALTQGAVADDLASLTQAIQEQRYGDVPAIMASIKAHAGQIGASIAAVAPSLPGFGSGANGGSGPDTTALFGNAPTAQLGIPRFEVTLPDTVMKPLGDFAAVIPAFTRATDRLYEAADMIVRSGWGLQKPTGLAPL